MITIRLGMRKRTVTMAQWDAIRKLETGLPVINGTVKETPEFLGKVSAYLTAQWNRPVTSSAAWQIWIGVYNWLETQRQNNRYRAEVGYWYGCNPHDLSEVQLAGLHANLSMIKAQHAIEHRLYDPLDFEHVYSLFLNAYGDEARAIKARGESMRALVMKETEGT